MTARKTRSKELVAVPSAAWVSRAPWHLPWLSEDKAPARTADAHPPVFYAPGELDEAETAMALDHAAAERQRAVREQENYDRAQVGGGYDWHWYRANRPRPASDPAAVVPLPAITEPDPEMDERVDALWRKFTRQGRRS